MGRLCGPAADAQRQGPANRAFSCVISCGALLEAPHATRWCSHVNTDVVITDYVLEAPHMKLVGHH